MEHKLDRYDRAILAAVQDDASLSTVDLAERVGLSQAPCWRRMHKLRQEGYIRKEVTLLDRAKLGWKLQILVQIHLSAHGRAHVQAFTDAMVQHDRVLECLIMLGSVDAILRVVAVDMQDYERFFFDHLSQAPGVREANSMVILSEAKFTTNLPVNAP